MIRWLAARNWAQWQIEFGALWRITAPLLVAQLCYTGMGAVDAMVAGRSGLFDLSGVAVGTGLWIPLSLFLMGICYAVTPLTAKADGAQNQTDKHAVLIQSLWIALGLGTAAGVLLGLGNHAMLAAFDMDRQTLAAGSSYLTAIAFGFPGFCLYQALRSYLIGLGETRPEMWIALVMVSSNVVLSAAFVFGWGPLPAMGAAGCGIATSVIFWCAALWMLRLVLQRTAFQFDWPRKVWVIKILALGIPIGMAIFIEASIFSAIALFLSPLGAVAVAGHQIALNVSTLVFMFPLTIAMAVTSRIGFLRGQERWDQARFSGIAALVMGGGIATLTCVLTLAFRPLIIGLYGAPDIVFDLAVGLLLLAAIYQIPDAIQVIGAGVLRGWEDSKGPLVVALICYWVIGLPGGIWLGVHQQAGPQGFWIFLIIALTLASLGVAYRMRKYYKPASTRTETA